MIDLILYLIAAICLALAAFGVSARQISLGWMGWHVLLRPRVRAPRGRFGVSQPRR